MSNHPPTPPLDESPLTVEQMRELLDTLVDGALLAPSLGRRWHAALAHPRETPAPTPTRAAAEQAIGHLRDHGEPGWRPAKGEHVSEVVVRDVDVIVLGTPAHDDDDNDSGHDCDAMGCGQCHVLFRAYRPTADAPPRGEAV